MIYSFVFVHLKLLDWFRSDSFFLSLCLSALHFVGCKLEERLSGTFGFYPGIRTISLSFDQSHCSNVKCQMPDFPAFWCCYCYCLQIAVFVIQELQNRLGQLAVAVNMVHQTNTLRISDFWACQLSSLECSTVALTEAFHYGQRCNCEANYFDPHKLEINK